MAGKEPEKSAGPKAERNKRKKEGRKARKAAEKAKEAEEEAWLNVQTEPGIAVASGLFLNVLSQLFSIKPPGRISYGVFAATDVKKGTKIFREPFKRGVDEDGTEWGEYEMAQRLNHACVANTTWSLAGDREIEFFTSRDIKKGEELTIGYIGNDKNLSNWIEACCGVGITCPCPTASDYSRVTRS